MPCGYRLNSSHVRFPIPNCIQVIQDTQFIQICGNMPRVFWCLWGFGWRDVPYFGYKILNLLNSLGSFYIKLPLANIWLYIYMINKFFIKKIPMQYIFGFVHNLMTYHLYKCKVVAICNLMLIIIDMFMTFGTMNCYNKSNFANIIYKFWPIKLH